MAVVHVTHPSYRSFALQACALHVEPPAVGDDVEKATAALVAGELAFIQEGGQDHRRLVLRHRQQEILGEGQGVSHEEGQEVVGVLREHQGGMKDDGQDAPLLVFLLEGQEIRFQLGIHKFGIQEHGQDPLLDFGTSLEFFEKPLFNLAYESLGTLHKNTKSDKTESTSTESNFMIFLVMIPRLSFGMSQFVVLSMLSVRL
jgi:hypothetical protein